MQALLRVVIVLVTWMPSAGWSQVGREYVTIEGYVGLARAVRVGQIVKLERVDYPQPQSWRQNLGKPYRVVFEVSETIRGDRSERLELVLSLQSTHFLEYMRDHAVESLLVSGPNRIDSSPNAEVGIAEQGKRFEDERYQFRLLTPVKVPENAGGDSIPAQLNRRYDSCRMFTNDLEVITGREAILKRARAFARAHTDLLSPISIQVPNEFGALCGTPNAFSIITLPMCPGSQKTLLAVKADPYRVLGRVQAKHANYDRAELLKTIEEALAKFSAG